MSEEASVGKSAAPLPFAAPCRLLAAAAPLRWIRLGWQDFRRAPRQSLVYGAAIVALSWFVTGIGLKLGSYWAALVLLSGFVFVAPVLAIGLYSISRQLDLGQAPSLARCAAEVGKALGTAMVYALALLVLFLVWARAGSMVHVFFPVRSNPDWGQLAGFLAIGTAVGSIFALLTFMFSAFSLPMICDREVDAITAIVSSVNAVLRNKPAMVLWAVLIGVLTAVGFATVFVGLVIIMPWLAYATWHAYRETLQPGDWPMLD